MFVRRLAALVGATALGLVATLGLVAAQAAPLRTAPTPDVRAYLVPVAREPGLTAAQRLALVRRHIKYVFVLYQENRSFDSYFGTYPGADGIYSRPGVATPGFVQPILNTDGTLGTIGPFRIGPAQFAADTDDVDHSHDILFRKMDIEAGHALMDHFALAEERKYSPHGKPSLKAKQFGELAMAYEDCDTVPILWRYADRFALYDHIFQEIVGPSTPGNLSIIAAQTGVTQWMLHPAAAWWDANHDLGEPVANDADPLWGSPRDPTAHKIAVNAHDFAGAHPYPIQLNQSYASLPLTLAGRSLPGVVTQDTRAATDLADVRQDVAAIGHGGHAAVDWRWFEEGFDHEPTDSVDPTDATGQHASYITHHNGPQYFGYIANNPVMRAKLRGLADFFAALKGGSLPAAGGVFYVKGGYDNIFGLKPADPAAAVQRRFLGDDDHPGYSDAEISEAMVARAVNAIAASRYWKQAAIIITWDDSEGDYDHVPPPALQYGPNGDRISDGPRVPLLLISPYARVHAVVHAVGNHASVVKFVDALFALPPLASLPDELEGRKIGRLRFHQANLGPEDALTPDVTDLLSGFDAARLSGRAAPLPPSYAETPARLVDRLPAVTGYGCKALGIVPVDAQLGIHTSPPADFNPRPKTEPSPGGHRG